ncbi:MAG: hypothetical protein AAF125_02690 [Chloroflexota bacterium]
MTRRLVYIIAMGLLTTACSISRPDIVPTLVPGAAIMTLENETVRLNSEITVSRDRSGHGFGWFTFHHDSGAVQIALDVEMRDGQDIQIGATTMTVWLRQASPDIATLVIS